MSTYFTSQTELFDVLDIEERLQHSFSPVQPDREFVTHVKTRLVSTPDITLENQPVLRSIQILAFGLFAGILLIWLIRFLYRVKNHS